MHLKFNEMFTGEALQYLKRHPVNIPKFSKEHKDCVELEKQKDLLWCGYIPILWPYLFQINVVIHVLDVRPSSRVATRVLCME